MSDWTNFICCKRRKRLCVKSNIYLKQKCCNFSLRKNAESLCCKLICLSVCFFVRLSVCMDVNLFFCLHIEMRCFKLALHLKKEWSNTHTHADVGTKKKNTIEQALGIFFKIIYAANAFNAIVRLLLLLLFLLLILSITRVGIYEYWSH